MPKVRYNYNEPKVAIFVDGPNMLRKEFSLNLHQLKKRASKYGNIVIAKVFINQYAPEKLIEAIMNEGFEAKMVLASKEEEGNDVDVALAVEATEAILTKNIDVLVLVTRDADFLPLVQKAKEYGKKVVIFGAEPGFSTSLRNAADYVEYV